MTRRIPRGDLAWHWRRCKEAGDPAARERLILHYAYLVHGTRLRLYPEPPWRIDPEELESEGLIGLIRAVDRFQPGRGVGFPSYAITWIRGAMREFLRAEDWMPRSHRVLRAQLEAAEVAVRAAREEPEPAALASALSCSLPGLFDLLDRAQERQVLSWEELFVEADEREQPRWLQEGQIDPGPSVEERVQARREAQHWQAELAGLPEREAEVLRRRYWRHERQVEVARALGISETRVSQLADRALSTLRERAESAAY